MLAHHALPGAFCMGSHGLSRTTIWIIEFLWYLILSFFFFVFIKRPCAWTKHIFYKYCYMLLKVILDETAITLHGHTKTTIVKIFQCRMLDDQHYLYRWPALFMSPTADTNGYSRVPSNTILYMSIWLIYNIEVWIHDNKLKYILEYM